MPIWQTYIFCSILLLLWINPCYAKDDATHQTALSEARDGQYDTALDLLQPLTEKHSKPNRYLYDYLSILGWAERYQQITQYESDLDLLIAPRYVLDNVAFAFRQVQSFSEAERIYLLINQRFSQFLPAQASLGLVLIDQQKLKQAEAHLLPIHQANPENMDLLNALAYLYRMMPSRLQELMVYEKILAIDPNHTEARRQKILLLNELGAAHLANDLIGDASLFSENELAAIESRKEANMVRWGEIPTEQTQHRFVETDLAIAGLKRNIMEMQTALGPNNEFSRNAEFDLLVALRDRYFMDEVVLAAERLVKEAVNIPAYAWNAYCDALLYLERPAEAVSCYTKVIETSNASADTKIALFYAYLENEQYDQAKEWVTILVDEQPLFIQGAKGRRLAKENKVKTNLKVLKAVSFAFADDLANAEAQLSEMAQQAPNNIALQKELANVYYWRGWSRKAQAQYDTWLPRDPKNGGLRLGWARNKLALKQYQQAEVEINKLLMLYPEDKGLRKQYRLWEIHNMRELRTEINGGRSSGNAAKGSRDMQIDSYLYSAPMQYNYRAFIHYRHNQASFTEGDGRLNDAGVGLEYRAPKIRLEGSLDQYHFGRNRTGLTLTGEYELNDYWQGFVSVESISKQTPLRALNQGIDATAVSAGGHYRWSESRIAGLNVSGLSFSDGNQRRSIGAFWQQRWYNRYAYKFATRLDLFASTNSEKNTIYFNPKRDFSTTLSLENEWLSWRQYENSFHQRLILSMGLYQQQDFGSGAIWDLAYEHRWQVKHQLEVTYGVAHSSKLYDGDREANWRYRMALNWRF